jgi:hypothetical protein
MVPVVSGLRRLKQEDISVEASLGRIVKPCLKKKESKYDAESLKYS